MQTNFKQQVARLSKWPLARQAIVLATHFWVPRQRVGVSFVALNDDQEVFMLRHVFHPHYEWGLPGGWLKRHEAPEVGILRELKEETGLTAVLGSAIAVLHNLTPPHIGIAYSGKLNPGKLQLSHEIIEAQWFPIDALPTPLTLHTKLAIEAATAVAQHDS